MNADKPAGEEQQTSLLQLLTISLNTHIRGKRLSPILLSLKCIAPWKTLQLHTHKMDYLQLFMPL